MSSLNLLTYHNLYGAESCGSRGAIGVKIMVAASRLTKSDLDKIAWSAGYDAYRIVESALIEAIIAADPEAQARRAVERTQIIGLFAGRRRPLFMRGARIRPPRILPPLLRPQRQHL